MKVIEIKAREPPLTLQVGRTEEAQRPEVDWDAHFAWLNQQPVLARLKIYPELTAEEKAKVVR